MILGELIKTYIDQHSLTYEAFAKKCGITKGYVSMLIKNLNNKTKKPPIPTIMTYQRIADAMEMTLDELFNKIDDSPVRLSDEVDAEDKKETKGTRIVRFSNTNPKPDLNRAASAAVETLINYNVVSAPIDPMHILKCLPGVFVATFTEMADADGLDNDRLVTEFGGSSQDAVTIEIDASIPLRVVAYNQRMPFYMLQMALARELGHIVLEHDGPVYTETEIAEALHFARHLLCPRPLIHAIQAAGVQLTVEGVGNITGCYGRILAGVRKTDGAHVPANKNRQLRARFADYLARYLAYQSVMAKSDDSTFADFGSYMDNYVE